jgi:hypothetical protein
MTTEARLCGSLERALAAAGSTHDLYRDVAPMLARGDAQYWANDGAAIVTEILAYPRARTLNFWLIGGELAAALELAPAVEAWGRAHGCVRAAGLGRRGWMPTVAALGYRPIGVAFRKELEP